MPFRFEVDDETAEKCGSIVDQIRVAMFARDLKSLTELQDERHKLGDLFVGIVAAAAQRSEETKD